MGKSRRDGERRRLLPRPSACGLALLALAAGVPAADAAEASWRLEEAVGAPAWLELGGTFRLRSEGLSSHLRPGVEGSDRILVSRLLLDARVGDERLFARVELEDARAFLDDEDTPLGTDDIDAAEVLQAHVGGRLSDALREGDRIDLQAGRMTLDLGSRRLVARNRFRNTINGFTGVHGAWRAPAPGSAADGAPQGEGPALQAFFLLPVERRPTSRRRLDDNEAELDCESSEVRLWGLHLADPRLAADLRGEAYVLGLTEDDRPGAPTRDRRLVTAGGRILRPPARARWDFEVEAALQRGETRRSTSAADTTDLDQQAWFAHAEVARTFDRRATPRLVLLLDYASGDEDPDDGRDERFDTLFGARRFEFGPTGIFGVLARSNLRAPGVRLELTPGAGRSLMAAWRPAWLASRHDVLTTNGVGEPEGEEDFIGHLVEVRYRTSPLPGNLGLELGAAHLVAGELLSAPPASLDDSTYGYLQITFTF